MSTPELPPPSSRAWVVPVAVGLVVAALQGWFVARTAAGMPIDDQWGRESTVYAAWLDGSLRASELWQAHNEHRILWTHLLNLLLFAVNGQWDPLVQVFAIVALRACIAGGLAAGLSAQADWRTRGILGVAVAWLFLPHLSWHNVQWGFQSQVYFSLGFSLAALWLLGAGALTPLKWIGGVTAGAAAQFGMSAGAFVPLALLALAALEIAGDRRWPRERLARIGAALLLAALAAVLRVHVPEHDMLRATSQAQFADVLGRSLAWPYPGNAWAAVAMNLPLALVVFRRLATPAQALPGENYPLLLGFFALAGGVAQAAFRGGGDEFAARVPSRYTDFMVPLVLANAWCVLALLKVATAQRLRVARISALAWLALLVSGWLASSSETWNGIVRAQLRFRDVTTERVRAYQLSRDPAVFEGYRRLFVPSSDPVAILRVLVEPRLAGRLPPALQPERPMGPLSVVVHGLRGHGAIVAAILLAAAAGLVVWRCLALKRPAASP